MPEFIFIADCVDPDDPQGRTYSQINAAKNHGLTVGTMVEYKDQDNYPYKNHPRAFIAWCGRDCDETPLYWLTLDRYDTVKKHPTKINEGWFGGIREQALTVVEPEKTHDELSGFLAIGTLVETTHHKARAFVVYANWYRTISPTYWLCLDYKETQKHHEEFYNVGWVGPYHAAELVVIEKPPKSR